MNWDTVNGDWKQFSGKVKEKWGNLTDDDLSKINGQREQKGCFRSDTASLKTKPRSKSTSGRKFNIR